LSGRQNVEGPSSASAAVVLPSDESCSFVEEFPLPHRLLLITAKQIPDEPKKYEANLLPLGIYASMNYKRQGI
jgi:hypothetical protein